MACAGEFSESSFTRSCEFAQQRNTSHNALFGASVFTAYASVCDRETR